MAGFNHDQEVPEWASFFNKQEYNTFLRELEDYFQSKGSHITIQDSAIIVDGGVFSNQRLGLTNVAQVCRKEGLEYYRDVISSHFGSMERGELFRREFEKNAGVYEKVKSYIGVRLYPKHYMDGLPKGAFIGKPFTDDIYAMLIFDQPDTITNIKPEQAEAWGKTLDDIFLDGVNNIRANNPPEISSFDFDDFSIWFAEADHFFVPNIVFDLESRPDLTGRHGALVGIPHRHAALIYPINNMEIIKAINGLIPTIYGMYREGPGSLSPSLLWYHQGKYINLPYEINDQNMSFRPPEVFVELLNKLAEETSE